MAARSAASIDLAAFLDTFFEEAEEHLAALERGLLALEGAPRDGETLADVFRAAHSIKGASATFGLRDVATFTHSLEGVLARLRAGAIVCDAPLAALLLEATDVLRALVQAARDGAAPPDGEPALRARLEAVLGGDACSAPPTARAGKGDARTWRISFAPARELLARGMDPVLLLRELAEMADEITTELDSSAVLPLEQLDPESCGLRWTIRVRTARSEDDLREVFAFAEGLCELSIVATAAQEPSADAPASLDGAPPQSVIHGAASTVRIATDKLDRLLDLVGELAIAQSMLVEAVRDSAWQAPVRVSDALAAVTRDIRDLQEGVLAVRMVPLSTVFRRLPRIAHDLAAASGKKVRLVILGEDTEIDKGMVEQLVDPLTHLVRNAIDHGLERPGDRRAAGKPEEGTLRVRAMHHGGNVVIEVEDDGRGVPTEAVRKKAAALGLLAPDAALSDDELHDLIFRPGFSTATTTTDVSGRGVGMDVVKRNVEGLGGQLRLTTRAGSGTRLTLRLPLTLAILDGLAVGVASQTYVLPLLSVVESFRPTPSQVRRVPGARAVLELRGVCIPLVPLRGVLGLGDGGREPADSLVCVLDTAGGRIALVVDELGGQHQAVVKSLGFALAGSTCFAGATILGDGRVAMILDVQAIAGAAGRIEHHPAARDQEAA